MNAASKARSLLLVEDNPGDAQLVADMLAEGADTYNIIHVPRLGEAIAKLESTSVDVVVLDLRLPDGAGIESVRAVREAARHTPIVVLTGTDDEQLALACIDAGAQDYLSKAEVQTRNLTRTIGYSITRLREAELRELHETLERYRALSTAAQKTTVTAAMARSGAVRTRSPNVFASIVQAYYRLLEPYLTRRTSRITASRAEMELLITRLGDENGGPRDLLDAHLAALDRANQNYDTPSSRAIVFEARLVALEMMGLLVDYYRVGHRRRFEEGTAS